MHYRRSNIKGASYFFTVNLAQRRSRLLVEQIDSLRHVMNEVKHRHPFRLEAMVVLPEHLHALWTLPEGDRDFITRWSLIKAGFSRRIYTAEPRSQSRQMKGERGIWQRRYWEHLIRDENDYRRHIEYIHYNPVKHGYVDCASDWPYSTIHKYIAEGLVESDWASGAADSDDTGFGEGA